jgi:2-polyprenyl-3-methyl-5-hydroxy-6-metoxy-1,4-benzoquinol methylase
MPQNMYNKYSKPSADIHLELEKMFPINAQRLQAQRNTARILEDSGFRIECVLCEQDLKRPEIFTHRDVQYAICGNCGHIQTRNHPPEGYPHHFEQALRFKTIYTPASESEYQSRALRIYRPKLDWLLDTANQCGYSVSDLKQSKWVDLGCGAGHFLWTLKQANIHQIQGFEKDPHLRSTANQLLCENIVQAVPEQLHATISETDANVWTAFFMLEHLEQPARLFEALSKKASGTLFCFAIPVFGFATLLESAVDSFFARQLDSVLHTQLYTDSSIQFVLASYGYEPLGQWIFGQDGCDLARMLSVALQGKYPATLLNDVNKRLFDMADGWQHVIDTAGFAETRHVLAVKQ